MAQFFGYLALFALAVVVLYLYFLLVVFLISAVVPLLMAGVGLLGILGAVVLYGAALYQYFCPVKRDDPTVKNYRSRRHVFALPIVILLALIYLDMFYPVLAGTAQEKFEIAVFAYDFARPLVNFQAGPLLPLVLNSISANAVDEALIAAVLSLGMKVLFLVPLLFC